MDTESRQSPSNRFLTIRQTAEAFPAFSEGGLRWLAFNREANGFASCVLRIGRRLLVDERAFLAWLEGNREAKGADESGRGRKAKASATTSPTKPRPSEAGGHR